jgi:hypothetical protein
MKAWRHAATPTKVPQNHEHGLEINRHKKMLKMKIAPDSLLKTKGQKKCSGLIHENKQVIRFSR